MQADTIFISLQFPRNILPFTSSTRITLWGPGVIRLTLSCQGALIRVMQLARMEKRYLFTNGIRRIELSADGLSTIGNLEKSMKPWRYPDNWVVEMFAPEGPKIFKRGEWFYLVSAVGGTAGPATSHMVIAARSRSIHGTWDDSPHNPIVHTEASTEPWWSRGHASLVEGPDGSWWMVYHGYENGFPHSWTADIA